MPDTPSFTDGRIHEKEFTCWPALEYPFEGNPMSPDIHARIIKRKFWIDPARYVPKITNRTTRQNVLLYSEQFDNVAWTKSLCAITANQYANPIDGALTADLMVENGGVGSHGLTAAGTAVSGILGNVLSVFVKQVGAHENIWLEFVDSASATDSAMFDLAAGVVMPVGTGGSTRDGIITRLPDGWFLVSMGFSSASGAGTARIYSSTGGAAPSGVADNGSFYFFGAHLSPRVTSGVYICTTSVARTVSVPDIDGLYNTASLGPDIFAIHTAESAPTYDNRRRGWIERTYARIPREQITPSTKLINRPSIHGLKSGTAFGASVRPGYDHIFTSRKSVGGGNTNPSVTATNALPGTNITITDSGGHVATFAANASKATIDAALAALTSLTYKSSTVWDANRITISWTGTVASYTFPSGVLPSAVRLASLGTSFGFIQFDSTGTTTSLAITTFPCPTHGGTVGDIAVFWQENALIGSAPVASVPDADTFSVLTAALGFDPSLATHCAFSSDAAACYTTGPKVCAIQRISRFYLPSYTEGITTPDTIPTFTSVLDGQKWFDTIIAAPTWATVDDSELSIYAGNIYRLDYAQVKLADALVSVTP